MNSGLSKIRSVRTFVLKGFIFVVLTVYIQESLLSWIFIALYIYRYQKNVAQSHSKHFIVLIDKTNTANTDKPSYIHAYESIAKKVAWIEKSVVNKNAISNYVYQYFNMQFWLASRF